MYAFFFHKIQEGVLNKFVKTCLEVYRFWIVTMEDISVPSQKANKKKKQTKKKKKKKQTN